MGRIQSSSGLITGIPIQDTVDKLMAVASQPLNLLSNRTKGLQSEKLAVAQLTSLLVAFQFETKQLAKDTLFDSRTVSTSGSALTAAVATDGTPAAGSYLFTPVQTAASQQVLSQSFGAAEAIGAGSLTFSKSGYVDNGISLDALNAGVGVTRGKIRVTDRSGQSAVIDLSYARSVDDVLAAISTNTSINVTATAVGDTFKLTDNTGGSGNLKVQEVAGGRTAADLGLASIDVAQSTATGTDVFSLHSKTALTTLNDGTGVQLRSGNDLTVTLADESSLSIDLGSAKTLGDVITAINAASPTKLTASIGSDGNRIQLKDLTTGSGAFAVSNVDSGTAATDLGLTTTAAGDTINGRRLVSGLRDTLASSLKGGTGLGTLGHISITNRNNVSSDVNLGSAETLGQIVTAINSQAAGVTAAINSAHNGIQLTDTTGATASNLIVTDGDANNSATALGLVANTSATKINSGALQRRQISAATLLSSLNGGAGIKVGDFRIADTNGVLRVVDLNKVDDVAVTVGDVVDRINSLDGLGVHAQINERGDGIELIDTVGGTGKITATAVGTDTTAADLHLLGTSTEKSINGIPKQVIDGTESSTVTFDADDTLSDVVTKINALGRGVTASLLNDGTRQRISISSDVSGEANSFIFDTSNSALSLQEISSGRDALLQYGTAESNGALISSSTNDFQNVIDGLNVTVNEDTPSPVTVTVKSTSGSLVTNVKEFVASYNSLRDNLAKQTSFDPDALTTGILFGSSAALRTDSDLSRIITGQFFGVGQFDSLGEVGISVDDKGKLSLDETKLTAAFNKDPEALKKLFTDDKRGFATKLDKAVEGLAGSDSSALLTARSKSLQDLIDSNNKRLDVMSSSLDRQRERLLLTFYNLETTVSKLRDNLTALSSLQVVPPLTSSN